MDEEGNPLAPFFRLGLLKLADLGLRLLEFRLELLGLGSGSIDLALGFDDAGFGVLGLLAKLRGEGLSFVGLSADFVSVFFGALELSLQLLAVGFLIVDLLLQFGGSGLGFGELSFEVG